MESEHFGDAGSGSGGSGDWKRLFESSDSVEVLRAADLLRATMLWQWLQRIRTSIEVPDPRAQSREGEKGSNRQESQLSSNCDDEGMRHA